MQTELIINRGGFPPFSARGCQQVLQPVEAGELRRTVNGELVYTGKKGHQKYASRITCEDQATPAIEGIWRGETVTVECIQRLWQESIIEKDSDSIRVPLERPAVKNSITVLLDDQLPVKSTLIDSQHAIIKHAFKKGATMYLSYRPVLRMRVRGFYFTTTEWQQSCGWRLELEEI